MVLARWASYDKKTLARQVTPLAPGYQTALSLRPETVLFWPSGPHQCSADARMEENQYGLSKQSYTKWFKLELLSCFH